MKMSSGIIFERNDAALFVGNHDITPLPDTCDPYDYLTAVGCGVTAGCIDIFLVGSPGDSVLGKWTDSQVDNFVMFFAKKMGWSPRAGQADNVHSAIGFLEKRFKVNYDQPHGPAAGNALDMTTKNHHLKSLAHSPSIVGLFFSLLNQFTGTSTFLSGGQLITIKTDTFELQGSNFISRLFCGFVNWIGHIISDMAGSSGAKGRGSGVPIPFFELFQLCNFGKFNIKNDRQDLATLATRVFQDGYDFRFGLAMAVPVVMSELSVRLIWSLKRLFYHKRPLKECIPLDKQQSLRTMLIVAHGTLCVMDAVDAGVRSGGNALLFALRINVVAWYRLTALVLKEVFIRLGIAADVQQLTASYKAVNGQLNEYISHLEKIDMERYKKEAVLHERMVFALSNAEDDAALNRVLLEQTQALGLTVPWEGDAFHAWMDDKNNRLVFY